MESPITQPDLLPVADWLEQGKTRFGSDYTRWRFECPICHHVQTPADFIALKQDPQSAYQECIGRHLPDRARNFGGSPAKNGTSAPCDYAAYGLIQSRWKVLSEGNKPVPVFPFATVEG